jgi:hypothetical protein
MIGERADTGSWFRVPPRPPSHTALHDRLVRDGILARPLDEAPASSYYEPADGNGDRHIAEGKSMDPIKVARFEA